MQNNPGEAIKEVYERALKIDPSAPVAANNLAFLYADTDGNLDQALALAKAAAGRLPDEPAVTDTIGWVDQTRSSSRRSPCRPSSRRCKKAPRNPEFQYHLGLGGRPGRRHTEGAARAGGGAASECHIRRGRRSAPGACVAPEIADRDANDRGSPARCQSDAGCSECLAAPPLRHRRDRMIVLFIPTVRFLIGRWTVSVWHNAHGMFVPPLVAWLAWQELKTRTALPVQGSAWGFLLLIPALILHALDAGIHTELLSAVALLIALPGLSLLFLGVERTKAIAFPLGFMVFALPIPLGITETLHLALRHLAVAVASTLLPYLGISVFAEGTTLHLTNGALQVADACSGFSTLDAAFAVATLAAYTAGSGARRVLVLLAAAPIAIASNVLRVILLVVMVHGWGPDSLHTILHPLSGMLTFALALPLIFWLGGPVAPRRATP